MAFTVEDGSIVAGANSYVPLDFANSYHLDRGNAAWADKTDPQKQSALIRATDYIEQTYGNKFLGSRVDTDQPLEWPRQDVSNISYAEIPNGLKQAVCQLAYEALSADLNPSLERGGAIKRERLEGVAETEYFENAPSMTIRPAVAGLLRNLLDNSNPFNAKVTRV